MQAGLCVRKARIRRLMNNPKKSFQPRKHMEDTETQYIPGATIHHLAGDEKYLREAYDLVCNFPCDSVANAVYRIIQH